MKKYVIIIIVILIALLLISCSQQDEDETVRIWMYGYDAEQEPGLGEFQDQIERQISYFADENDIKIEFNIYSLKEMAEEDYMLKRNLALEHGDADIVIGDMYGMHQASKYAADYTKLSNYKNIFDNFKGYKFVPIGSLMTTIILDKQVLEAYGIESDKYITLDEYYEIKQRLKAAGVRFKYESEEHNQLRDYYINKNDLKMINENGQFTIDRQIAIKTAREIAEDIVKNYDTDIYTIKEEIQYNKNNERIIYDEALGRPFAQRGEYYPLKFLSFTWDITPVFEDYVAVIENNLEITMLRMPCMILNKNSKKENADKVADFLLSDKFQSRLYNNTHAYSSITDTSQVRQDTGYNDDRSYKYEPGKTKIYNRNLTGKDIKELMPVVQDAYELFKNTDTEKFFTPSEYRIAIRAFIGNEALKMVENPSYGEEDFNRSADEYLTRFNVLYN
ncbi:extracellular solute-binding protein [Sedimentibacter sp.]|uniref:extracellular solute-binding protein n=1 Tax=Sedimentibacter sp. TaxID=1960295 RepID=UPI0028AB3CDD|nr:extracellular solute-binding protein [Sedimentibacter sp.]